jgi:hypothetical protein
MFKTDKEVHLSQIDWAYVNGLFESSRYATRRR